MKGRSKGRSLNKLRYCSYELLGRFLHYFTKYPIQYVGVVYLSRKLVMNALTIFLCEAKTQRKSKIIDGFSILLFVQGKPDEAQSFSIPKNYTLFLSAKK